MRIAGAGCALIDHLYSPIDEHAAAFAALRSRTPGDGGLVPGQLVFMEALAEFSGRDPQAIIADLTAGATTHAMNIGGPAIVSLILAAQVLQGAGMQVEYHGAVGDDSTGLELRQRASRTPLDCTRLVTRPGSTASTVVLNDPNADGGRGERTFVNTLGVAAHFEPKALGADFFTADLVLLAATALVPPLHRALSPLLGRARQHGGLTVVGTVYDFLNQNLDPAGRWPLGDSAETYPLIDLLVCDEGEALRLSGAPDVDQSGAWFSAQGVGAWVITRGAEPVQFWARPGGRFAPRDVTRLPVLEGIAAARAGRACDTTGAGDNFLGGVITSLALQRTASPTGPLDLLAAVALGVCAGGCACLQLGGVCVEERSGHKRAELQTAYSNYQRQLAPRIDLPGLQLPGAH